jgi:thiamine biosynthesis lipoprotein ApbE
MKYKKLNETDLSKPFTIMNGLRANNITADGDEINLSLTGGGMDFSIQSKANLYGIKDREAAQKITEDAVKEIQEIIDAYLIIINAKLRMVETKLLALK